MTGRDLIVYILQNGLENEPVFKDGKFLGFLTTGEAARKAHVGSATIDVWATWGLIDAIQIDGGLYIPADFKPPMRTE